MACNLSKGRIIPCNDAIGGIKALYFFEYDTLTPAFDAIQTNVIENLGLTVTCYKYDIKNDASGLAETMNSPAGNGVTYVDQVISAVLARGEWSTNAEIKLLAYGRPHVVVHFKTGEAVIVGLYNGASLETGVKTSGNAAGDLNGYTLTINGQERTFANYLEGATEADPFAGLTNAPTVVVGAEVAPA